MEYKFNLWIIKTKKMLRNIEKQEILIEAIKKNNNKEKDCILIQNTGVKDRKRNDVFDGNYILYDTGILRDFMKVKRGRVEFAFYRWDKYKKRWRKSTYQGVETYGEVIGNIYEGIKSKRLYNEMQELGIFN